MDFGEKGVYSSYTLTPVDIFVREHNLDPDIASSDLKHQRLGEIIEFAFYRNPGFVPAGNAYFPPGYTDADNGITWNRPGFIDLFTGARSQAGQSGINDQ